MAKEKDIKIDLNEKVLSEATAWMAEVEFVNNPHFLSTVILNAHSVSGSIKNVELFPDLQHKKMLFYLELTWFGKLFRKKKIAEIILDMMSDVLPAYEFRVVYDSKIRDKALALVKRLANPTRPSK